MDIRGELRDQPLRVGISTRSLFDLEAEHEVFVQDGVAAYVELQREREDVLVEKGSGFKVVEKLLGMNEDDNQPYVEVILLSKNSPDLSLRAFNSIKEYGLNIKHGSFTSGRTLAPFIQSWGIDLFLSNDTVDEGFSTRAIASGFSWA